MVFFPSDFVFERLFSKRPWVRIVYASHAQPSPLVVSFAAGVSLYLGSDRVPEFHPGNHQCCRRHLQSSCRCGSVPPKTPANSNVSQFIIIFYHHFYCTKWNCYFGIQRKFACLDVEVESGCDFGHVKKLGFKPCSNWEIVRDMPLRTIY